MMQITPVERRSRRKAAIILFLASISIVGCNGGPAIGVGEADQSPDPVIVDYPIAYVKRPLLMGEDEEKYNGDVREPAAFNPGAVLYLRDRLSASAKEHDISGLAFPADTANYDVKDLSPSYDGQKLLFALRAPEIADADDEDQPTWDIWEYNVATKTVYPIMSDAKAAANGDDISPHYLPDGRIVFSSTRQQQGKRILTDEGKPQFSPLDENRNVAAFSLHVMNADGSDIHQITVNPSHDLAPSVLTDGRIVFTRWNNVANHDAMNLYTVNPDGTELNLLYGYNSHDTAGAGNTIQFLRPQEIDPGKLLVLLKPYDNASYGGDLSFIDTGHFADNSRPTFQNLGLAYDAQQPANDKGVLVSDATPSPAGRYLSAFPLLDRSELLVSWSPCRLLDRTRIVPCTSKALAAASPQEADPLYGIWLFDYARQSQIPVIPGSEGFLLADAVVLKPSPSPDVILDAVSSDEATQELVDADLGVLKIRSIYDVDGADAATPNIATVADPGKTTADQRNARFLRLVKSAPLPDEDLVELNGNSFGRSTAQLMREILGYVPIEPDGSVNVKVPANVAFTIDITDRNGQRISTRHNHWLEIKPGETLQCHGCHAANSSMPHGRTDAEPPAIHVGATTTGVAFPNTDPALFPNAGESMADVLNRINGIPAINLNVLFDDIWPDPADNTIVKSASIAYKYQDLATASPVTTACLTTWTSACRSVINYPEHIQPLWKAERKTLDADGVTVLADHTCVLCHSTADAMGAAQVPAAQLDLTDAVSPDTADHVMSYRELLFADVEQELINGAVVDKQVQATDNMGNPLFETDDNGALILDDDGNPIPIFVTIPINPLLSTNGAKSSPRFYAVFEASNTHDGWLSNAELRLISEWNDIGAQYYNNPFSVPQP